MIFVKVDFNKISSDNQTFAPFANFTDITDPGFSVSQGQLLESRELWAYEDVEGHVGRGTLQYLDWQTSLGCILLYMDTVILDYRYSMSFAESSQGTLLG